jgi:hypothetical protein
MVLMVRGAGVEAWAGHPRSRANRMPTFATARYAASTTAPLSGRCTLPTPTYSAGEGAVDAPSTHRWGGAGGRADVVKPLCIRPFAEHLGHEYGRP